MDCYEFRYTLTLMSAGPDRLRTMAALRSVRPDLTLTQAKAMIATLPVVVLTDIWRNDRDGLERRFRGIADVEMSVA